MYYDNNWATIIPMANEEADFEVFIQELTTVLNRLQTGTVYLVVDTVSKDCTLKLCRALSEKDKRFITVYAPENKNVVDAYICGYKEAYQNGHDIIIEMDAGMSHDPKAIPMFLRVLNEGNECAFGSRFINGGSMVKSPPSRVFLSRTGTFLSNLLLGTKMYDMTSGYQGFHASIVKKIIEYPLLSKAHFYQTEIRYLLRHSKYAEIPIHYQAPSPSVSKNAIKNSIEVLWHYFINRFTKNSANQL
ncbi:glycosyltransferase [Hydrotalea sp.]|uniref:glycosyltransferase n=1 Tax=Hydrotalea sp. TaxID=2881279 RepID=UPI0026128279|nr:glycosyltransferase [Hydrotalea sp.]